MIPKIIHYFWFGRNPLPPLAIKCIESWKKYLPDYEIKEWNEDNFDVNIIQYTKEAYEAKKYAFVSDYARFWVLYKYGGVYFDTDVEVLKPLDNILSKGGFMGCETDKKTGYNTDITVNPGLGFACEAGNSFLKDIIEIYKTKSYTNDFANSGCKTIVDYTTDLLKEKGLKNIMDIQLIDNLYIYPCEYFNPTNIILHKLKITQNTHTIHHYSGSWLENKYSFKDKIRKYIPKSILLLYNKIKN